MLVQSVQQGSPAEKAGIHAGSLTAQLADGIGDRARRRRHPARRRAGDPDLGGRRRGRAAQAARQQGHGGAPAGEGAAHGGGRADRAADRRVTGGLTGSALRCGACPALPASRSVASRPRRPASTPSRPGPGRSASSSGRAPRGRSPSRRRPRIAGPLRRRTELVGLFVNATPTRSSRPSEAIGLSWVQLHGDEGPSFADVVGRRASVKVIKAARVRARADVQAMDAFRNVDAHLLDAYSDGTPGGTGETFDWSLARQRLSEVPLILAGGLTAGERRRGHRADEPLGRRRLQRRRVRAGREGPREGRGVHRRRPGHRHRRRGGHRVMSTITPPLRALRGPVRPRDAHARPGRARGRLGRGARRPRLGAGARGAPPRLRRAGPRRSTARAGSRSTRAARSTSSARTSTTRARTRSTTRSGRRCWPSAWARRGSSRRPARASTASRRPPPARSGPRVHRLHGRRGHEAPDAQRAAHGAPRRARLPGRGRERDAEGRDERGDPRLGHERGGHPLHHRLRRRPGALPRARARPPAGHRRRGARAAARARGAPARPRRGLRRRRLERHGDLRGLPGGRRRGAHRRRGRGRGDRHGPPRRAADRGQPRGDPARLDERDHAGRRRADRRGPLHLRRPGLPRRRAGARVAARLGRARPTSRSPTRTRSGRSPSVTRLEGIIPALETAHAFHHVLEEPSDSALDLLCLSGRGDKDLAQVLEKLGAEEL